MLGWSVADDAPDEMPELACCALPATAVTALQPETTLHTLESTTHETGHAILRQVRQAPWEPIDAPLTQQHRRRFPPEPLPADGHATMTWQGASAPLN